MPIVEAIIKAATVSIKDLAKSCLLYTSIYVIGDDQISVEDFKEKADAFFDDIYPAATRVGGLVSGEHAIGSGKLKYLAEAEGERNMELMLGIKKVFDPKLILNPGKVCYKL